MIRPVLAFMLVVVVVVLLALLLAGRSRGKGAVSQNNHHPQRIEGIGLEGWHRRAVRNRRTINHLRRAVPTLQRHLTSRLDDVVWLVDALRCVHTYEGDWSSNTGNGYYGGLQMDLSFQRAYGRHLLTAKGTADNWTPAEQITVAITAHATRGFWPWPNTARRCGLLR